MSPNNDVVRTADLGGNKENGGRTVALHFLILFEAALASAVIITLEKDLNLVE